jgi:SAM-dependent methyltransferase
MVANQTGSDLEGKVAERINGYLINRKSFEILDQNGNVLVAKPDLKQIAAQSLDSVYAANEINPENLSRLVRGWDRFWAQEKAADVTETLLTDYPSTLPGRSLHYELLANSIDGLFNSNGHNGIAGKQVVELGSGTAMVLLSLARKGAYVTGIDTSIMAKDYGTYLFNKDEIGAQANLVTGDFYDTPFDDGKFDVSLNSGVFEHRRDRDARRLLDEMIRITKPGGYIVIAVPNDNSSFYQRFKENEREIKKSNPNIVEIPEEEERYRDNKGNRYTKLMTEAGLVVVKVDGIQVAPSTPIKIEDIKKNNPHSGIDIATFNRYLPRGEENPSVNTRVATWSRLEQNVGNDFRMRYGWSMVYVAQKPGA